MAHRPRRTTLRDENVAPRTLSEGAGAYEWIALRPDAAGTLVLGLGPHPVDAAELIPDNDVVWCDCPDFINQMEPAWRESAPAHWREVAPSEIGPRLVRGRRILLYRQSPRLFPSFWGPLLGRCRAALLEGAPPPIAREVWLPADERSLLAPEIADAMRSHGMGVRLLPPNAVSALLPRLLRDSRPELFVSVNFQGMDPEGEAFHLLRAVGAPVAVWLVDNPFHLLSGLKSTFWRETDLFVTDASFLPLLREHGAKRVHHLPLATWPALFARAEPNPEHELAERLLFVGRSEFPDRSGFFSGLRVPSGLGDQARSMLAPGERPDFHWWRKQLGITRLWPGNAVREAGLGAEESGRAWRAACLREAAKETPLTVVGDAAWSGLVPGLTDLRAPVDYYGPLGGLYASAAAVLNVTGLLLPAGLTQRHFDVWAAGGLLLSDENPGLAIFPRELTELMTFRRPQDIPELLRRLTRDPALRRETIEAWRALILAAHTYAHRTATMIEVATTNGGKSA